MKQPKFSIVIALMVSSIFLLLVLQVFWLKGAYRDAADNFRKETNLLFRNTIFAMHDTLIQRSIEPMAGDSLIKFMGPRRLRIDRMDSLKVRSLGEDSVLSYVTSERQARVEIIVSQDVRRDSLQGILKPILKRMQNERQPKTFVMKLTSDSLKADSIRYYYAQALAKADIRAPFEVITLRTEKAEPVGIVKKQKVGFVSEIVRLGPMSRYAVSFSDINGLLLREITPQILFSVFLTLLTIGSFYMMYRSMRNQQRLMEMKNDFISNVTHELKTPVATVSVALEALKNFRALDDPQRTSEYLNIAQNELSRLTLMTDKILKTVIYEAKGLEHKTERMNFDTLIQQILASMKLVFEKKETKVEYHKEGTEFELEGSHTHLTHMVYNLLDNALKYSGEAAHIQVALKRDGSKLLFSVHDNGIGIESAYQKKIFEKFFRVPSGDVHNTKGYGLGLSYVASVVKSHRGEIQVDSEPGKGSCFTITLPVKNED